jgi:catechol 2,3-dioxygenase-like lactoylglutathione lyase family enzyme
LLRLGPALLPLRNDEDDRALGGAARVGGAYPGARFQFTVGVEDWDAMCEALRARGVELLNGPMDRPWGVRTATFRDPAGYIWEIAA